MVKEDFFDLLRTFGSWVGLLLTAWVCSSTPDLSFSMAWVCAPATKYIQWAGQVLPASCLALAAVSGIPGVSGLFPESCSGFAEKVYIPPVHSSSNSPSLSWELSEQRQCCLMHTVSLTWSGELSANRMDEQTQRFPFVSHGPQGDWVALPLCKGIFWVKVPPGSVVMSLPSVPELEKVD